MTQVHIIFLSGYIIYSCKAEINQQWQEDFAKIKSWYYLLLYTNGKFPHLEVYT
ncbi:uncharacterized protein BDZ83DRAFT_626524 [Colletotrichum acutatum]|uniref:Uncharacterized protein n=1 Tax=Glomerella acutata TaxID=27357 RepID=A0AAD8UKH7_GLOAC|nr:uncharacterized protein BDZ83DRAFT_626524 [Colletotrichum acutatum]KAK1723379.1 hypothetical protein BDZ83DRAFT_626524 [Colletotrichum acutatum]